MNILTAVIDVFTLMFSNIITWLTDIVDLFWDGSTSQLTFFGVLSVVALAISVFFLLVRVVQNFLHFRG